MEDVSTHTKQRGGRLAPSGAAVDAATGLQNVLARLAARGIAAFLLELTRPEFQVPVVRVLASGLQIEPCAIVSERLALVMRETGGGAVHTGGLPLL